MMSNTMVCWLRFCLWCLQCWVIISHTAHGYQTSPKVVSVTATRRAYIDGLAGAAASLILGFSCFPSNARAVISSKSCASGIGEGCDDLSEGNEFIRSLQQKSAANADAYARVSHII